jgi:hypothetical protein
MRNRRITTYFLLGYLALLLNVGPSAHHADFLGLHGDSCCHVHVHALEAQVSCCDDHGVYGSSNSERPPSESRSLLGAEIGLSVSMLCEDCFLCQYFDQFSAIETAFAMDQSDVPVGLRDQLKCSIELSRCIDCTARGPPSISLG